ncbi:hypothetical protein BCR33DRAFT_713744 [Rhizoclosmatium globosum]|uniref:Uncharacterized protein n=1 Tax=Rhizoclosmatium globosum TaxID=329046 RepID=A0A1Y2CQU1_9FUNG|nr:hypothetical protein BCR33DRAFT_713744 [Rhizoclosmatium globosum]|eukprot:ORY49409.1 hypothetical protein BCR33DRAFT_713744 [Rhizoclosmatium globosum]
MEALSQIDTAIDAIASTVAAAAPYISPILSVATYILENCRASTSKKAEYLSLGDLVARMSISIMKLDNISPYHAEAVRKAMYEIKVFLERNDTSKVDAADRFTRNLKKLKAIVSSKYVQVDLAILRSRLIQEASSLGIDLQVRTVIDVDEVKRDTEQLFENNAALLQKLEAMRIQLEERDRQNKERLERELQRKT